MEWDLTLDFKYDLKKDEPFELKTNLKPEYVRKILSEYLRSHIGAGKDNSPSNKKDIYRIVIGLNLSDDSFGTYSDTGNKGLTDHLVMKSIGKLEELAKNQPNLSEQPSLEPGIDPTSKPNLHRGDIPENPHKEY